VEAFGRHIAGARTAIVPNAAHMVPYEQPTAVLRIVDEWVNAKEKAA
jgi:pimeloyl-ACP methyl ester carboxylesterase